MEQNFHTRIGHGDFIDFIRVEPTIFQKHEEEGDVQYCANTKKEKEKSTKNMNQIWGETGFTLMNMMNMRFSLFSPMKRDEVGEDGAIINLFERNF